MSAAALVPLPPKADGTKRMGIRLLDAAVSFHKQVRKPASAVDADPDALPPQAASLLRKSRVSTWRQRVLLRNGQHEQAAHEAKAMEEFESSVTPAAVGGTTADQRRAQTMEFLYDKKKEAAGAETYTVGRYRRLMPDDEDGVNDSYLEAFRSKEDSAAGKAGGGRGYGGIAGSRSRAPDETLGEMSQGYGSFRDDAAEHLDEFHVEQEDEEGGWYDQDANDMQVSAQLEAQDHDLFDAVDSDEEGEDDDEEGLTDKQLQERHRERMARKLQERAEAEAMYHQAVQPLSKTAASKTASAAASRAAGKKRAREEAAAGPSAARAGGPPMPRSGGPPLPRSGGPPAPKSSRTSLSSAAASSSSAGKRNPFDGSVDPKTAIFEEIRSELVSHGLQCKYKVMVSYLKGRIRALGSEYQTIATAALKRMATQEKNAQGETVYKLKREYWS